MLAGTMSLRKERMIYTRFQYSCSMHVHTSRDIPGPYGGVGNGKGINIYPRLDKPYRVAIPDIIGATLAITAGSGTIPEFDIVDLYIITIIDIVSLADKAGQTGGMRLILNRIRGNEAADSPPG